MKIYFYLGLDGDNGQFQVRKLLAGLSGDFSISLDNDLLIGTKCSKGRARKWIHPLEKSRLMMSDELGKSDLISCTKLRDVTGEIQMAFRSLVKDQRRNFEHICTVMLDKNCISNSTHLTWLLLIESS